MPGRRYPRRVRGRATTWAVAAGLALGTAGVSLAASTAIHQPARVGDAAHRMVSTRRSATTGTNASTDPTAVGGDRRAPTAPDATCALVDLVNGARRVHGVPPLRVDQRLTTAAHAHATDMAAAGVMRHLGSDGSDGGTRSTRAGYRWSTWGENVAAGTTDPAAVVAAWLASEPHRANLLGDAVDVGAATVTASDGTPYWALLVARPAPDL